MLKAAATLSTMAEGNVNVNLDVNVDMDVDVPTSILEIELPAILLNDSLFIELNGNLTQLEDTIGTNLSQIIWNRSSTSNINTNSSIHDLEAEQRAAMEFWLLVKMIVMAVVLGLMILVTIIGKYLIKIKSKFKLHHSTPDSTEKKNKNNNNNKKGAEKVPAGGS